MSPLHRVLTVLVALVAVPVVPAAADTTLVADPSAANVTTWEATSTSAWSRRAPDGTYRLVVRSGEGPVQDAKVAPSSVPFDPDLGPSTTIGASTVAYARCATGSATRGCDVYLYDTIAQTERKAVISSASGSEYAPSYYKGRIAFARSGVKKPGLYLYRPGRGAVRLSPKLPTESDLSETRVISLYQPGAPSGGETFVRLSNYNGKQQRTLARATVNGAGEGERLASPTLSRYNAFWLRSDPTSETTRVQRVGVNAHRGLTVLTATRTFTFTIGSLAVTSIPVLYAGPAGITAIAPKLAFEA